MSNLDNSVYYRGAKEELAKVYAFPLIIGDVDSVVTWHLSKESLDFVISCLPQRDGYTYQLRAAAERVDELLEAQEEARAELHRQADAYER